ncbi:MAG: thioredoxin [Bacteroidales bacterium]|nr:thioredoxin [Bacteroidales bacterium]
MLFAFITSSSSCSDDKNKDNSQDNTTTVVDGNNNNTTTTTDNNQNTNQTDINSADATGLVTILDSQGFITKVFDFNNSQDWHYNGTAPCVIDFYADWCGPCKMVSPIMDELAEDYEGKIIFYKVDVDQAQDVAAAFGIQSIPSVLFVPMTGQPQMAVGAMEKQGYVNAINQVIYGQQ